jgi:hypothetical protein
VSFVVVMGLKQHKNAEAIDPTISCENISQILSCLAGNGGGKEEKRSLHYQNEK